MTPAAPKTRKAGNGAQRKALAVRRPWMDGMAADWLMVYGWTATLDSRPPEFDYAGFDVSLARARADTQAALAEHRAQAREYDRQEQAIRACRPVADRRDSAPEKPPVPDLAVMPLPPVLDRPPARPGKRRHAKDGTWGGNLRLLPGRRGDDALDGAEWFAEIGGEEGEQDTPPAGPRQDDEALHEADGGAE